MTETKRKPRTYSSFSGLDLRVMRVKADVRASDLAREMGIRVSTISHMEGRRQVTSETADRYLAALQTLSTVAASREVA